MTDQTLKKTVTYFLKYLWLVCLLVIAVNFISLAYTLHRVPRDAARDELKAFASQLGTRIALSFDLLEGVSQLPLIRNTAAPLRERARELAPFRTSFRLHAIGLIEPDGTLSDPLPGLALPAQDAPGAASERVLADRALLDRLFRTGKKELLSADPAGGGQSGYTLFLPVRKSGKVTDVLFISYLFADLRRIVDAENAAPFSHYILLDGERRVIAAPQEDSLFKDGAAPERHERLLYASARRDVVTDVTNKNDGWFISYVQGRLLQTTYMPVPGTDWMLIHRFRILSIAMPAIIGFLIMTAVYLAVFSALYFFGRMYLKRELKPVGDLLDQIADFNREIYHKNDFETHELSRIIHISRKGLKDELTRLPNRILFSQTVEDKLRRRASGKLAAFFFIDMDNLKAVNDNFGHAYGDKALRFIGGQLRVMAEEYEGVCCRFGGDEFLLFVDGLDHAEAAGAIGEEICRDLRGAIGKEGQETWFHASVGIALYPLHADSADAAIQLADKAMYESKRRGKDTWTLYSPAQENGPPRPAPPASSP